MIMQKTEKEVLALTDTMPKVNVTPSPAHTKKLIAKSLMQKSVGPVYGKPILGKGGLKPYRPPEPGIKTVPILNRFRKPLRATLYEGK